MIHTLIQIWRFLMQPKVWRFVGFASSIVGLICYALSSSFNYLFGHWNLLKIFLYGVFSFIVSLMILFANIWQHSTSIRFKAHTAFLVLTITSIYSFFFDKVVNGKPDAYSLLSCAAFSIMSLSLSRQTQCGFEVDILYFFLGCLIIQLTKIKLQLFILGVGFSYLIIIIRSSFSSINVVIDTENPTSLQDENLVVIEVNSLSPQLVITDIGNSMVEQLDNCVRVLRQENPILIEMLLEKLKDYLSDDSGFNLSDPDFMFKAFPTETIDNLHKTAKLMVSASSEKVFTDVYSSCRRECLGESLSRLGFKKVSIEDVQTLSWKEIKDEIKRCIKVSNVALKILFPTERRLCDRIFFGFSSAADSLFMDVCTESSLQLLSFADAIAIGCRSPEQLFRVINMFETMCDLIPEFESLFRDQYSVSQETEATRIRKRLGEAIRGIFMELENMIRLDPDKVAVPGGLHPTTRYVMKYLRAACRSRKTLEQVFDGRKSSSSSLAFQMDHIIELLESSLESKSKIHKDPALCYVFLIKNFSYIVKKAEDSELGALLGEEWIKKHIPKILQYHAQYQRISWNKLLGFLKLDNSELMPTNWVAKTMKEKLKSFNTVFDDLCRVQSSWFAFDDQLGKEIRIFIKKLLLPAYENFIRRFLSIAEIGKHADKYIKYGTMDIEERLNNLF